MTEENLGTQISNCNANIQHLQSEKRKCEQCIAKLNPMIRNLDSVYNDTMEASDDVANGLRVNDRPADNGKIEEVAVEIKTVSKRLNSIIIELGNAKNRYAREIAEQQAMLSQYTFERNKIIQERVANVKANL